VLWAVDEVEVVFVAEHPDKMSVPASKNTGTIFKDLRFEKIFL
jgi:hypothetical protein